MPSVRIYVGRVVGFAVDPDNADRYFVAVASGGVWRTVNNGTTWTPVFDTQGSYAIGTVTIDPKNPSAVWVGTGENNNQRSRRVYVASSLIEMGCIAATQCGPPEFPRTPSTKTGSLP